MSGLKTGDRVVFANPKIDLSVPSRVEGEVGVIKGKGASWLVEFDNRVGGHAGSKAIGAEGKLGHCYWCSEDSLEKVGMTKERKNPKSFRNGDVIKITTGTGEIVFVKFGDNFYNLSDGGQMKGYKYLPSGRKEIISNLSGLGRYLAMSPEELEREVEGEKKDSKEDWGDSDELRNVLEEWEKFKKSPGISVIGTTDTSFTTIGLSDPDE